MFNLSIFDTSEEQNLELSKMQNNHPFEVYERLGEIEEEETELRNSLL